LNVSLLHVGNVEQIVLKNIISHNYRIKITAIYCNATCGDKFYFCLTTASPDRNADGIWNFQIGEPLQVNLVVYSLSVFAFLQVSLSVRQ